MSNCLECKSFLDTNSINDRSTYLKWLAKNHPDKFRKFGETDPRYINANADSKKATSCFSMWNINDPEHPEDPRPPCVRGSGPLPPPRATGPFRPKPPTRSTASRPTPLRTSFFSTKPVFKTKNSCKIGYVRNKSTKRCRKSCAVGQRRSRTTGRCLKGRKSKKNSKKRSRKSKKKSKKKSRKRSRKSRFVKNSPLGSCRGRKKSVCKIDPNCTYRRGTGCVKRRGAKKSPFFGPMMPDSGY